MKVKELIEHLNKCNPEYDVFYEYDNNITDVVEQTNHTDPSCNQVIIS